MDRRYGDAPARGVEAAAGLVAAIRRLAVVPTLPETMEIVTQAVRDLLHADGATFVLREGDLCHYADERAISPLWLGRKFPMSACISGWCMLNSQAVAIPDIYQDTRIPQDAYRVTFVRSLAMAPVRRGEPFAAVGAYWSQVRQITPDEVELLQTLADAASLAISTAQLAPVAEARLAAEAAKARYRAMFDQAAVGVSRVSLKGRFLEVNERFRLITGYSEAELHRLSFADITHPDDVRQDVAQSRALAEGEIQTYSRHKRYIRKDGSPVWVNLTVSLMRGPDGAPEDFITVIQDISEWKAAEAAEKAQAEHLKLLVNELNHRVKNTLATVQSLAAQTLRGATDPNEAFLRLEGRLLGLSAAHNLLTERHWEGATLSEVVQRSVQPFLSAPHRLRLEGPETWLRPEIAVALSLAFHELATNATKYGAWSVEDGVVLASWSKAQDAGGYEIVWREQGGPRVAPPDRRGFGSRLLERSLPRELGAPTTMSFQPDGVVCRIGLVLPPFRTSTA
jgi:PAS domain S-box-containing protein